MGTNYSMLLITLNSSDWLDNRSDLLTALIKGYKQCNGLVSLQETRSFSFLFNVFFRFGRRLLLLWTQTPPTAAPCTWTRLWWLLFLHGSAGTTVLLRPILCLVWSAPVSPEETTAALWSVFSCDYYYCYYCSSLSCNTHQSFFYFSCFW